MESIQILNLDRLHGLDAEAVGYDQYLIDSLIPHGVLDLDIDETENTGSKKCRHADYHEHNLCSYTHPVERVDYFHRFAPLQKKFLSFFRPTGLAGATEPIAEA